MAYVSEKIALKISLDVTVDLGLQMFILDPFPFLRNVDTSLLELVLHVLLQRAQELFA